jgi:dTDP-glucose 4,6-dehydratase
VNNVLIIGAAGFTGYHLIKRLIELDEVKMICNVDAMVEGSSDSNVHVNYKVINMLDEEYCIQKNYEKILSTFKPDVIINLASLSSVDTSLNTPANFAHYNVTKFIELLEAIRNVNKEIPLIHMSTDEVIGSLYDDFASIDEAGEDNSNDYYHFEPSSVYSTTKLTQEHLCNNYIKSFGMNITIIRFTNIFGTHQADNKIIPTIIRSIVENKPVPLYGNGLNKRTWLHVNDVVDFYINFLQKKLYNKFGPTDKIYHVSNRNNEVTNKELVNEICKIMEVPYNVEFVPDRPNHDYRYSLRYFMTSHFTGLLPKVSLKDGLKELINYYVTKYSDK